MNERTNKPHAQLGERFIETYEAADVTPSIHAGRGTARLLAEIPESLRGANWEVPPTSPDLATPSGWVRLRKMISKKRAARARDED